MTNPEAALSNLECRRCGIELPIRPGDGNEPVEEWSCSNCGCNQSGVRDAWARHSILANAIRVEPLMVLMSRRKRVPVRT